MSPDDIIKIIDAIPEYIRYLYPGYIVIYLYSFFRGYTLKDGKNIIVKSIAISFILNLFTVSMCNLFRTTFCFIYEKIFKNSIIIWKGDISTNSLLYNILLIVVAVLGAYISYRVIESGKTREKLKGLKIYTSTDNNEFKSLKKGDEYTFIRIYLKEKPIAYEGYLIDVNAEHDVCKAFLIINQYSQIYINEADGYSEEIIKDFYNKNKEKVLIYFDNIDRIEKCGYKRIDKIKKTSNSERKTNIADIESESNCERYDHNFNVADEVNIYDYALYESRRNKKRYRKLKEKFYSYYEWKNSYVIPKYEHESLKSLVDFKRILDRRMDMSGTIEGRTVGVILPLITILVTLTLTYLGVGTSSPLVQYYISLILVMWMMYYILKDMRSDDIKKYLYKDYTIIIDELITRKSKEEDSNGHESQMI